MHEIVEEVYRIMLSSKYYGFIPANAIRVIDAEWALVNLGVPIKGTIVIDGH